MSKNIKMIMISTGDRVIGDMKIHDDGAITVTNGLILKEILTQQGFNTLPTVLMHSEEPVKIEEKHIIISMCEPTNEVIDIYNKLTSPIIQPPEKTNLVVLK